MLVFCQSGRGPRYISRANKTQASTVVPRLPNKCLERERVTGEKEKEKVSISPVPFILAA